MSATTTTTIFANLDGSGVRALYARADVANVVRRLGAGELVRCDSDLGEVWVAPSAVSYVQPGRRSLPVSAGPSDAAMSQHARRVTPSIG